MSMFSSTCNNGWNSWGHKMYTLRLIYIYFPSNDLSTLNTCVINFENSVTMNMSFILKHLRSGYDVPRRCLLSIVSHRSAC